MVTLNFNSSEKSGKYSYLRTFISTEDELIVSVVEDGKVCGFVCLDRESAIKLAKEIRRQVSFMEEVSNG